MLAVVSAYLKHNQKKYYFTDSVLCNISSKKKGYKYTEELEYTLIDNMLSAGLYANKTSIRKAIKNKALTKMYCIQCHINEDALLKKQQVSSILYIYYPLNDQESRYQVYGSDDDSVRKELSDYNTDEKDYQLLNLGEHIRFKYKDKILEGYISCLPNLKRVTFERFCESYEVLILNGRSYDLLYDENAIHRKDIIEVLNSPMPIKNLYEIIVRNNHYHIYTEEYLEELRKLTEE